MLKSNNTIKFISRIRVTAGWFFFILVAFIGTIQNTWGAVFIFIGEIIRTIAAGTITKNEKLTTHGIYQFVRHPLYLGSFCISVGMCLICNNIFLWIYFVVFFPTVYTAAILNEENLLKTKFGDLFINYKKNVSAFIPLKIKKFSVSENFSWHLVFKNREHYNWLILLAVLAALFLNTH